MSCVRTLTFLLTPVLTGLDVTRSVKRDGIMVSIKQLADMFMSLNIAMMFWTTTVVADDEASKSVTKRADARFRGLMEINPTRNSRPDNLIAILGATLVDGRGSVPVEDSAVLVQGDRIIAVGTRSSLKIPAQTETVDAKGMTLMPGLLDSHLHLDVGPRMLTTASLFLSHGVTSYRDPGRPKDIYELIPQATEAQPRCFATGPHFDQAPHAYPRDCVLIGSASEARRVVDEYVDEGATVIKVYYRLPLELIHATCDQAHRRGIPVTAHLELVNADDAIRSGVDGIEHITSFGTALAAPDLAKGFRRRVEADNDARHEGRYELWMELDFSSERVKPLLRLIVERRVFISPTLAVFERRDGGTDVSLAQVRGFQKMLEFVGLCHKAGAMVVTGSHTSSKYSRHGWTYQREMELLVESGLTPLEVITASTWNNAMFFGCQDRLGSVEPGKLADLILVDGKPYEDIRAMYNIRRVMLGGNWVGP